MSRTLDVSRVQYALAIFSDTAPPSVLQPPDMGDLFSLSFLQIISILSFLTSVLAVVRVGSVSLHRLSQQQKWAADVPRPESDYTAQANLKLPSWSLNWSLGGLPASFSIDSLIGEDDGQPQIVEKSSVLHGGYNGGSPLSRMDWQLSRPRIGTSCPLPMIVCRRLTHRCPS